LERYDGLKIQGLFCELFFKNQGSDSETSGPRVDYPKVLGPFYKISKFNRNNKLFLYRKSRGLGPRVVDHGWVARSTVDRWRRGQEGAGAWQRAHWSGASSHSGAQELTDGGRKWRA
jgi:hypothetical protein